MDRRTFLSSTGSMVAGGLFLEADIVAAVAAPKDIVLDHLARETVRAHTRATNGDHRRLER